MLEGLDYSREFFTNGLTSRPTQFCDDQKQENHPISLFNFCTVTKICRISDTVKIPQKAIDDSFFSSMKDSTLQNRGTSVLGLFGSLEVSSLATRWIFSRQATSAKNCGCRKHGVSLWLRGCFTMVKMVLYYG